MHEPIVFVGVGGLLSLLVPGLLPYDALLLVAMLSDALLSDALLVALLFVALLVVALLSVARTLVSCIFFIIADYIAIDNIAGIR